MSLNILMIAYTNYSTDPRVIREAESLINSGYNVDFVALKRKEDPRIEIINGVKVIHFNQLRYRGNSNLFYFLAYIKFFFRVFLFLLNKLNEYKVIHVNNMPDFLVFSAILPKLFGTKIILDIHDPIPSTYQTKFNLDKNSFFYRLLLLEELVSAKFADKVITVHEPIKNDVLVRDGITEEKIEVIANFADESKFKVIEKYEYDDQLKLVFHGTIAERFGFNFVLNELSKIRDLNYSFTIIGEGDYSSQLKQLIEKYQVSEKVFFDNQFYPVNELPEILSDFNLGLVSYKLSAATDYMLPLKFLEYISLGLPSMCVMNRALSFYFNETDAFFFNSNEQYSLSNLIQKIISDPEKLIQKRERVVEIRKKFYWKSQAEKYNELVKKLIEE